MPGQHVHAVQDLVRVFGEAALPEADDAFVARRDAVRRLFDAVENVAFDAHAGMLSGEIDLQALPRAVEVEHGPPVRGLHAEGDRNGIRLLVAPEGYPDRAAAFQDAEYLVPVRDLPVLAPHRCPSFLPLLACQRPLPLCAPDAASRARGGALRFCRGVLPGDAAMPKGGSPSMAGSCPACRLVTRPCLPLRLPFGPARRRTWRRAAP